MRLSLLLVGLGLLGTLPADARAPETTLDSVLAETGLEVEDLRIHRETDWLGAVSGASVPFLQDHLPRVWDRPFHLPVLGANLLIALERVRARGPEVAPYTTAGLLRPRLPGFRGFPLLEDRRGSHEELEGSLDEILRSLDLSGTRFEPPVRRLLSRLLSARKRIERSWEGVPAEVVRSAVRAPGLPLHLADAAVSWPEGERAARLGDEIPRALAALEVVQALDRARADLAALDGIRGDGVVTRETETPWGRIRIGGTGSDRHECEELCLLVLDLSGDDLYPGSVAGARYPEQPVAAVLDLEGSDRYGGPAVEEAQGAGLGGVGALLDAGGDDEYRVRTRGQGFGLFGYGILADLSGRDRFVAETAAQGAALFGGGLLLGGTGPSSYYIHGEGQGFGGTGGAGLLVDVDGSDRYEAEPDPERAPGRGDVHQEGEVTIANAQGAGVGRRGDLTDGRIWAGGLGALVDLGGDDRYRAGDFAQGMGFFFGTGMLLDARGDDLYDAVYFARGSALHWGAGLLLDREGDDRHRLGPGSGAALGYGWDYGVGVLVDEAGDDRYSVDRFGLGVAERRSMGLFVELGGDDRYEGGEEGRALGSVDRNPRGWSSGEPLGASATSSQVGLFLDLGGGDRYPASEDHACDGCRWIRPGRTAGTTGVDRGVGIDRDLSLPGLFSLFFPSPARDLP